MAKPERLKLPAVESMILRGVEGGLSDIFDLPPERVVFFAGTNKMQIAAAVAKFHKGIEGGVQWPLLMLHVSSLSSGVGENMHAVNTKSMARQGRYYKVAESMDYVINQKMVPAVMEIEVIYMTDNFPEAFSYANQWIANAVNNRLNFSLTYMGESMDIRSEMSGQISTPDGEFAVDMPSVYEYASTVKVVGYITDQHPDANSKVQLLRKSVINVSIDKSPPADKAVYSSRHVMPIVEERNKT